MCINKQIESFNDVRTYSYSPDGNTNAAFKTDINNVLFPGVLDRGTPLIIKENGRNTVLGIFHKMISGLKQQGPLSIF